MRYKLFIPLAISLLLAAGCGGQNVLTNPAFQPQIINQAGSFSLQVTNVNGVTQTLNYTWVNNQTSANINQACQITSGTATLTIRDAAGLQVYSGSLAANGTYTTSTGTAGDWRITLSVVNLRGTLNFRVQSP